MKKAERTRQFIIETAAPIFNEKGIAGTSIDDVLRATNVAKGCLYNHFETKEDLSNHTIEYLLQTISTRIGSVISQQTTAKGKLFAYLDFSSDPLNTTISGGCPILNIAVESDDTNAVIKARVKQVILAGQALFTSILRDGISAGEFAATLNPGEFAFKMFASIEGATVICRVLESNKPMLSLIENLKNELENHSLP